MFETAFSQYLLIAIAVLILLGLKYFVINKSYNKQLNSFVTP